MPKIKVCLFGARNLKRKEHYDVLEAAFYEHTMPDDEIEIVSGGAEGIDELGEFLSLKHGLDLTIMKANWNGRGKAAGPHRNDRMADYVDIGIGIPGPESKGTYHMIKALKQRGKPVHVINDFTKAVTQT